MSCCQRNHVYQVLYPDPAMLLENIEIVPGEVADADMDAGLGALP